MHKVSGRRRVHRVIVTALLAIVCAAPVLAHHSFSAEFDGSREIAIEGVITRVSWTNPHMEFEVSVKGQDGMETLWAVSGAGGPGFYKRVGIKRSDFRIGSPVKITGYPARVNAPHMYGRLLEYPDGTRISAGLSRSAASDTE